MEFFTYVFDAIYSALGNQVFLVLIVVLFIGIVSQWRLYEKANQKGIASIVPVWNITTFLKIVGRPAWQAIFIIVPALVILGTLMVDFKDIFAFLGEGFKGFSSVAISLPLLTVSTVALAVFMVKVYIELCDSFGKSTVFDYILVVALNFLYILNLSLSYDTVYNGPVYGKKSNQEMSAGARQFA